MENNKLQELTQKLYQEGLSQGRTDAERMVADAEVKAKEIIADADAKAADIIKLAERKADELKRNTSTELTLAGRQAIAALKESIATMITAKSVAPSVHAAAVDASFVKEMLLAVARNWNGGNVQLNAVLPEELKDKFEAEFEASAKSLLAEGVEVGYSKTVKSGFTIAPKNGGYYISFTDADFDALLAEFLKEKTAKMLYD